MTNKKTPKELGVTGLRAVGNQVIEDEQAVALVFPQSISTFQKMKTDPIISGSLFMIKQFVRKVDWNVKPYGGVKATQDDKDKAEFISDALFKHMDRSFDQLISDICSFIENGFAFHEPVYKVHKGGIVWKDIASRHASSIKGFKFNAKGGVEAVEQYVINPSASMFSYNTTSTVDLPYDRLLHFRTDSEKNNPLGKSILKNAYKSWYFKSKLEEFEAIGVEREMNGLPKIEIPIEYFNADPVEEPEKYQVLQEFIRMGTNARNNEQACVLLPSDVDENGNKLFTFDLVASKGTRSLDTSKIIERYDFRIAQSLLADFLLMGSSSSGSFALSNNKVTVFMRSLEAYLEVISEQFNRRAIPKLYELNGWDSSRTCTLKHRPISAPTLGEIADFLQKSAAFITPDKTLENALRLRADLPERDDENLYISTPTATSQAISQRIGMMRSADIDGSDSEGDGLSDDQIEQINKALIEDYRGVS